MARQLGGGPPHQPEDQRRAARGDGRRRRHGRRGAPLAGRTDGSRLVRTGPAGARRSRRCAARAFFDRPVPPRRTRPAGPAAGFDRNRRGRRQPPARQPLRRRDLAPRHPHVPRPRLGPLRSPAARPLPARLPHAARRGPTRPCRAAASGGAHRLPGPGVRGARGGGRGSRSRPGRRPLRRAFRAQHGRRRLRGPAASHPLGHARPRRPLHRAQPAARDPQPLPVRPQPVPAPEQPLRQPPLPRTRGDTGVRRQRRGAAAAGRSAAPLLARLRATPHVPYDEVDALQAERAAHPLRGVPRRLAGTAPATARAASASRITSPGRGRPSSGSRSSRRSTPT